MAMTSLIALLCSVLWWFAFRDGAMFADDGSLGARAAARNFVVEKLKAPATAEFGDITAIQLGDGTWAVSGSVDSQNSFGALIRSQFDCSITNARDTWLETRPCSVR